MKDLDMFGQPKARRPSRTALAARSWPTRWWSWRLLLVALVLGWMAPSPAKSAPGPSFLLETIVVENATNVSPDIILAESLLEPGTSYTEDQLRDAIHRVVRLPFVLDADFALRKGTARDLYELVITVYEARTWFFGADLGHRTQRWSSAGLRREELTASNLTAGKRFFVGRSGELFVAIGGGSGPTQPERDAAAFSLGYNHYDLFGSGSVLSLGYGLEEASSFGSTHQASASLGIPLRTNQSFQLSTHYSWFDSSAREVAPQTFASTSLASTAAWIYNSLDDPALSTEGWRVDAEIGYLKLDREFEAFTVTDGIPTIEPQAYKADSYHLDLSAVRFWPLSQRQSVSARASAHFFKFHLRSPLESAPQPILEQRQEQWLGIAELGYQLSLFDRPDPDAWRQLRWETTVNYQSDQSAGFSTNSAIGSGKGWSASTGLVFRNSWGVYRFRFIYVDTRRTLEL